jgi:hypothetical protein
MPSTFGVFRGDKRFRNICPACNSRFGQYEGQLKSCGPEGILRVICFAEKCPAALDDQPFRATLGGSKPHFVYNDPDLGAIVYTYDKDGKLIRAEQLIIDGENGERQWILLKHGMHWKALKGEFDKLRIQGAFKLNAITHKDRFEEHRKLIKKVFEKSCSDSIPLDSGENTQVVNTKFRVTDYYFRAIAKMAFHYYLVFGNNIDYAYDSGFDKIKKFIYSGGNYKETIRETNGFLAEQFENAVPKEWSHLLAACEENGNVTVYVRLFWNPMHYSKQYYVKLGQIRRRLVIPPVYSVPFSHRYIFDQSFEKNGKCGEVIKADSAFYF